jgi:hypothetical protein
MQNLLLDTMSWSIFWLACLGGFLGSALGVLVAAALIRFNRGSRPSRENRLRERLDRIRRGAP